MPCAQSVTVSAIAVIDLALELKALGCIDNVFLDSLGARFRGLYQDWESNPTIQEARLPESLLIRLWQQADQFENSIIGLQIGEKVNPKTKGLLATWLSQSPNLREAFETFSNNIYLMNPSERWQKHEDRGTVCLSIKFTHDAYPQAAVDRSMAAALAWLELLSGQKIEPVSVEFMIDAPRDVTVYRRLFGESLSFGQSENRLYFERALFDAPITQASPYLKSLLGQRAISMNAMLKPREAVSDRVVALLQEDLPRYCQIEAVCLAMHLSRSSLYRRLKDQGTSYTDLVTQVRIAHGQKLEHLGLGHDEIAASLGFQDSSSYYRFRKRHSIEIPNA